MEQSERNDETSLESLEFSLREERSRACMRRTNRKRPLLFVPGSSRDDEMTNYSDAVVC